MLPGRGLIHGLDEIRGVHAVGAREVEELHGRLQHLAPVLAVVVVDVIRGGGVQQHALVGQLVAGGVLMVVSSLLVMLNVEGSPYRCVHCRRY